MCGLGADYARTFLAPNAHVFRHLGRLKCILLQNQKRSCALQEFTNLLDFKVLKRL